MPPFIVAHSLALFLSLYIYITPTLENQSNLTNLLFKVKNWDNEELTHSYIYIYIRVLFNSWIEEELGVGLNSVAGWRIPRGQIIIRVVCPVAAQFLAKYYSKAIRSSSIYYFGGSTFQDQVSHSGTVHQQPRGVLNLDHV